MRYCIALVCLLSVFGCGGGPQRPAGMPALHPCVITVLQEGKPLAGVTVSLVIAEGEPQWKGGATTDERGVATVVTYGEFPGVRVGLHKVLLTKRESIAPLPPSNVDAQGRIMGGPTMAPSMIPAKDYIDPKYSDEKTTEFSIDIKPKQQNTATLDVGPPPR